MSMPVASDAVLPGAVLPGSAFPPLESAMNARASRFVTPGARPTLSTAVAFRSTASPFSLSMPERISRDAETST